jgi:hypothetical protein
MLTYFVAYVINNDSKQAGFAKGANAIESIVDISFDQYAFMPSYYRNCLIFALVIEAAVGIVYIFLRSGASHVLVIILYLFGGLLSSISDSIYQCYKVEAADLAGCTTWAYSLFETFTEVPLAIGSVCWPQLRKVASYTEFWLCSIGICAGMAVIAAAVFYTIPLFKHDKLLVKSQLWE